MLFLPLLPPITAGENPANWDAVSQKLSSNRSIRNSYSGKKSESPNICPICGRSRDTGTHTECLKKILPEETAVICPSCGLRFYVENPKRLSNADRDLCSHTPGAAGASGEIHICMRCGFSYLRNFFRKAQGEQGLTLTNEQREWIAENLTPRMYKAIRKALANMKEKYQPKDQDLYKLFNDTIYSSQGTKSTAVMDEHIVEREVPDTLRCENALLFAKQFFSQKPLLCARMAQLTAWAYRREVTAMPNKIRLLKNIQRLQLKITKELSEEATPKQKVDQMLKMFDDKEQFNIVDRELLLIMLAGNYQRLGATQWAKGCITQCIKDAKNNQLWTNPAIISAPDQDPGNPAVQQGIWLLRSDILQSASPRLKSIDREAVFLQEAASFLREALAQDKVPVELLPAHVYLVGEFERRSENFARSYAWLTSAAEMSKVSTLTPGAEIWSQDQLGLVIDSLRNLGHQTIPPNPMAASDTPLLQRLEEKFKKSLQSETKAE